MSLLKAPPQWKLKKLYRTDVTLHKISETVIDDEFGQTEETETTYSIKAEIHTIMLEDMIYLPPGEVSEGDCFGYFLPKYLVDGQEVIIEVNDYVTFQGNKYLVQRVEDLFDGNTLVYKRAFLKKQVGQ